jgi:hypothetical protein
MPPSGVGTPVALPACAVWAFEVTGEKGGVTSPCSSSCLARARLVDVVWARGAALARDAEVEAGPVVLNLGGLSAPSGVGRAWKVLRQARVP